MFEDYKKTLNHSQIHVFEKLENQINKNIQDCENLINGLNCIEFYPKKDGTEKSNFKMNFGLCKPFGENYTITRWNGAKENCRFAVIEKNGLYQNKITSISIKLRPQTNYDSSTEVLPETPFKRYIDDEIYLNCKDVDNFAGFNVSENQDKINAKFVFNLIKNYYIPQQIKRLENYKKELKELPKYFDKFIDMACKMQEIVKNTSEFSTLHHFAYENFEAKQTYYILKNEYKR